MSTEKIFADAGLEALRRKFFPRVPWTEAGPVRRRYRAKAAREGQSVEEALTALARAEGFLGPGQEAVLGDAGTCLAAFRTRGERDILVFGQGPEVCWCDMALGPADEDGWREMIVRSEEAENLAALAHAVGAVRFRPAGGENGARPC